MRVKKQRDSHSLQAAWALATAGLMLVIPANVEPVLTFNVAGNTQSNLVVTGVFGLFAQGYWPVALLVFFGAIAAPAIHLAAVWYVLAGCCSAGLGPNWSSVQRSGLAESWNLVPADAIATLVAVEARHVGRSSGSEAIWVVALPCVLLIMQIFDRQQVESRLEELPDEGGLPRLQQSKALVVTGSRLYVLPTSFQS
jgi:paraquat-inducible protein A